MKRWGGGDLSPPPEPLSLTWTAFSHTNVKKYDSFSNHIFIARQAIDHEYIHLIILIEILNFHLTIPVFFLIGIMYLEGTILTYETKLFWSISKLKEPTKLARVPFWDALVLCVWRFSYAPSSFVLFQPCPFFLELWKYPDNKSWTQINWQSDHSITKNIIYFFFRECGGTSSHV